MDILEFLMRLLHIGSAVALVGGWIYMLVVLSPAMRLVHEGLVETIQTMAAKRFIRISHPSMTFLLISGFHQFWINMEVYRKASKLVQPLIGLKMLLALAILFIIFAHAFKVLKGSPLKWAKINLALSILVVVLAVWVRQLKIEAMIAS